MTSSTSLVLALDGGQSSTLALIAENSGRILGVGLAGPSNHVHEPGGLQRLHSALSGSIRQALNNAGVQPARITHLCLGLTGGVPEAAPLIAKMLPDASARIEYDMVTALAGASIA